MGYYTVDESINTYNQFRVTRSCLLDIWIYTNGTITMQYIITALPQSCQNNEYRYSINKHRLILGEESKKPGRTYTRGKEIAMSREETESPLGSQGYSYSQYSASGEVRADVLSVVVSR